MEKLTREEAEDREIKMAMIGSMYDYWLTHENKEYLSDVEDTIIKHVSLLKRGITIRSLEKIAVSRTNISENIFREMIVNMLESGRLKLDNNRRIINGKPN